MPTPETPETPEDVAAFLRGIGREALARVPLHLAAAQGWARRCPETASWHEEEAEVCRSLAASYASRAEAIERGEAE